MLRLRGVPSPLSWLNEPLAFTSGAERRLTITAGQQSDWFVDPSGQRTQVNAPAALFALPDPDFLFSARVTVAFGSTYDAGALAIYEEEGTWAKLCLEYSPQRQPMVVSVVTRGTSDDCNSAVVAGRRLWLRIHGRADTFAFHYSHDGSYWNLVRHFTLGSLTNPRIGFLSQSPSGTSCTALFEKIAYGEGLLTDLRSGE